MPYLICDHLRLADLQRQDIDADRGAGHHLGARHQARMTMTQKQREIMKHALYSVWWPDQGQTKDDARAFYAFDHERAAAEWADWYDNYSADYCIVSGIEAIVHVQREDQPDARRVLVTGEISRTYSGHLMDVKPREN